MSDAPSNPSAVELRPFRFRLRTLLIVFTLIAIGLGIAVGPLPSRLAEEFEPLPDHGLRVSWMLKPGSTEGAWTIKMRWYAERPFKVRFYRHLRSRDPEPNLEVFSQSQLIGHNAVMDYEVSFSESTLKVTEPNRNQRLVGARKFSNTDNIKWMGIPIRQVVNNPNLSSGWNSGLYLGGGNSIIVLQSGAGDPLKSGPDDLSCYGQILEPD